MASRLPPTSSPADPKAHPDFQPHAWAQALLASPSTLHVPETPPHWTPEVTSVALFTQTLAHPSGIRAKVFFRRPSPAADALRRIEDCYILSLGSGLDGATGRAHGGLSSALLDHLLGTAAGREGHEGQFPPATVTLTVRFRAPIATPAIVLVRAWVTEVEGRKVWARGSLEDGKGGVFAEATALFVHPKEGTKAVL